jgi:hypothetical protein
MKDNRKLVLAVLIFTFLAVLSFINCLKTGPEDCKLLKAEKYLACVMCADNRHKNALTIPSNPYQRIAVQRLFLKTSIILVSGELLEEEALQEVIKMFCLLQDI